MSDSCRHALPHGSCVPGVTLYISGAQGSGKSTLLRVLSPRLHAHVLDGPQMREIVGGAYPGVALSQLSPVHTFAAFMLRALGRHEAVLTTADLCLSDGSLLNDLAYLRGRIEVGAFGDKSRVDDADFIRLVDLFEAQVCERMRTPARRLFAHLDPHLPLEHDGYRPAHAPFRDFVNDYLLALYRQLNLAHFRVTGSIAQRCDLIETTLSDYRLLSHAG